MTSSICGRAMKTARLEQFHLGGNIVRQNCEPFDADAGWVAWGFLNADAQARYKD